MRRTEARSAGIHRPAGVARRLHVSLYKVEPSEAVTACNLFSKDDWRSALTDEMEERGPQMPLVSKPAAFACRAERLAGAGTSPDGSVIRPSGATQCVAPDSDAGEKMALFKPGKVIWTNILNTPFINHAGRDMPGFYQFP